MKINYGCTYWGSDNLTPSEFVSKVVDAGYTDGTGNFVVIQYQNGDRVRFMHLSKYEVKKGDDVFEGQIFAKTGNTGYQSPGVHYDPHLHIDAADKDGKMVNPLERAKGYGTVSNKDFFEKYNGDYKKLKDSKIPEKKSWFRSLLDKLPSPSSPFIFPPPSRPK